MGNRGGAGDGSIYQQLSALIKSWSEGDLTKQKIISIVLLIIPYKVNPNFRVSAFMKL